MIVLCSELPRGPALEVLWRELEGRAHASFFQSWLWVGTWLECLPANIEAHLLKAERSGTIVGLGVLVPRTVWRHGMLRSRALFLNATGDPHFDELTIEYNGFLAAAGTEREVAMSCVAHLLAKKPDWDELFLPGLGDPDLLGGLPPDGARVCERYRRRSHFMHLAELRDSGLDYLASLGRPVRQQIRRSIREYEKVGPLRLDEARDAAEALRYLRRLGELHQQHWEGKGRPGSFANRFFTRFHERLIERAFPAGGIQLLRVTAGEKEVGYLYNLVYRGQVYFYQSGLDYRMPGSGVRPGIVSHVLAIEHNLRQGHSTYDFSAGDDRYKRELSTSSRELAWQVVQRPRLKLRIEDALRRLRAGLGARWG